MTFRALALAIVVAIAQLGCGDGRSTRAELESVYAASVAPSTLGIEFVAGGLAGLLWSERPDAPVTNM